MLIGELARLSGLTPDTIRFYEKKGLLDERHMVRLDNNYKEYTPEALERLIVIARVKRTGFTLSEIARWMQDWDTLSAEERREVVLTKVEEIESHIEELEKAKARLINGLSACVAGKYGSQDGE